ncbi:repetin-like [Leptopilina heterotoma]|uniref:repetin-like n=1 Tax=Leptopilina heterotoma TaxID=63436 RepID=UPI001CA8681A|nr:repetin-like [Leptopilina heterotoma]
MWKIICALLFFQRALSAPSSRCMEICNNRNSQYLSNTNCCASSLVASTNEKKNWTDHKDFQTHDGALVHTKDGEFSHGNTHGNFNEMSYYKEFKSGDNQHFGSNHNFGNSHDISQKLEDLSSSSSHSTFESMFQSRFSDLIKNFHESFRHLQELKTKDQLPVQDCQYPCVPINEQISRLQQDVTAQQQHMQRMREDLWSKMQNQNTVTETEHVIPSQHLTHSNHQTGQVTKETNRYESYQNDKITTSPHITTTITKQPVKYTSHPDQSQTDYYSGSRHESTQNYGTRTQGQYPDQSQRAGQDYYSGSVSRHDSSQNYASGTQDQTQTQNRRTSYPDQSSQNYYSGSGSKLESQTGYNQQNSIHDSRVTQNQNNDQNSSQYGQNYATGIQSQAGYAQDTTNYERRNRVSQAQRADQQEYASGNQNQGQTQGNGQHGVAYGYHASYGSKSYYSSLPQDQSSHQSSAYRTHQNSQSQGYGQHSGYRAQSGYQTDGSQSQGEYNPQGSLTYSHNSMSHSSLTQNNADFGASSNGKLTHGLIQTGSAADCNDEVQSAPYRRYKRHIHSPNHRHHYHHHHHHNHQEQYPDDFSQQQDDFQQGSISSKLDEFGEPTKIEKVPQKEIEDLSQQVEDIRNGKVDTQDLYQHQDQHQDFSQQHKFPEQSQTNYYQTGGFDDFPPSSEGSQTYDQQNHGFDDQYHYSPRGFNQKTF